MKLIIDIGKKFLGSHLTDIRKWGKQTLAIYAVLGLLFALINFLAEPVNRFFGFLYKMRYEFFHTNALTFYICTIVIPAIVAAYIAFGNTLQMRLIAVWKQYRFEKWIFIIGSIGIGFIIYYLFNLKTSLPEELAGSDKALNLRNIAVALAAIATAVFTWWKNTLSNRTNEIQEQARQVQAEMQKVQEKARQIQEDTRLDELFTKAVELLKQSNDLNTRKAGVYILKDLAMTSPKHAQKSIDMLCALNETWMPKFLKDYPDFFIVNNNFQNIKNIEELKLREGTKADENYLYKNETAKEYRNDVALSQVVLQTLSDIIRYISANNTYAEKYNLDYKFLCSIYLSSVSFAKFTLGDINLQSAYLLKANLQSAFLWRANLQSAALLEANLQSAVLWETDFQSADLRGANLQSADLRGANLQSADLREANLQSADLREADLRSANLQSAVLIDAKLQSADLRLANLQYADLERAYFQSAKFIIGLLNLPNTNFTNAKVNQADFRNTNIKRGNIKEAKSWEDAYYDGDIIDEITGEIIKKAGEPDAPNEEGE